MNQPPQPNKNGSGPSTRFSRSILGWIVFGALAILLLSIYARSTAPREISTTQFWNYVENGQITGRLVTKEASIEGELDPAKVQLKQGESHRFVVNYNYQADQAFQSRLHDALAKHDFPAQVYQETTTWWRSPLLQFVFMILIFAALYVFLFRRMGAAGGGGGFLGSFGRSRHRVLTREKTRVTFSDVAGINEAKEEVTEIIEFLRDSRRFQRLGGRVPRGVLLVGEPGCGKTLLAKAIAGEAQVPFFSISGSDFVEMFVGVGASRVRDLFKQAKDSAPCIIFLDEIDAVGRRRGMGFSGGGHDEREQTLNAILVEMDGFDSSDQVIVIAATNRADVLDPALTRPGRFDRQIVVPLPDVQGRVEILKIYAARVKCGPDVDLHRLARGTPMFSGADLAALVNEAAIAATMANKEFIEQADMEEARDKVRWGRARKNRVVDEKEKEITAYHEAGHALVQVLMPNTDPLHKVSIIPRGGFGGATFSLPEKDRYLYTREYCRSLLGVMFGGRLAEEIFCHDISSGASNDISNATELARKMVLDWGMSDKLGLIRYSTDERRAITADMAGKEHSDRTAEYIDQEVKAFIDDAYGRTRALLQQHQKQLKDIADALLKYETLSADEVNRIIEGKGLEKPTVDDLLGKEEIKPPKADGVTISPRPQPEPQTPPLPEAS